MPDSVAPTTGRVFISYRREETAYAAGWLFDRLADRFGRGQIFKDVDSIELGDDFVEVITSAVASCDVLLAVIGERWLTIPDKHGRRRLDDPDDFVRLEIEAALTRNVRVIPILVDGARMPHADELPPSLAKLVRRQALELSPSHFEFDTGRLHKVLDRALADVHARPTITETEVALAARQASAPAEATGPQALSPPYPSSAPPARRRHWLDVYGFGRRQKIWLASGVLIVLIAAVVAVIVWPRHGNNHSGADGSPPAVNASPTVLWSKEIGRPITGRPAVDANTVYFGGQDDYVYALARRDGHEIWRFRTGASVISSPTVLGGVLYIASRDGYVYALSSERGQLRWRTRAGNDIHSSPTIVNGSLYIGSNDNAMYAFNLSGHQRWRFPTKGVIWGKPAVANGIVYFGSQDKTMYAVSADTGHLVWTAPAGEIFSHPTVADSLVFVGSNDSTLYAFDTASGRQRWQFPSNGVIGWVQPAVDHGAVYVGCGDGNVYAVDEQTGGERWRFGVAQHRPIFSSAWIADGVVYIGSHAARVYALNEATGTERWNFLTGAIVGASPVVVDGVLYVGSDDGRMYALKLPPT